MTSVSLPQHDTAEQQAARQLQLSLARTEYNYMSSYLPGVPLSADLPDGEKFSLDYEAQVLQVFLRLADNFKAQVMRLLERELASDLPTQQLERVGDAAEKLAQDFSPLHPARDAEELKALFAALKDLPEALHGLVNLPKDLARMATGLEQVFSDFAQNGPTAFLKNTLFDMLRQDAGETYLQAQSLADYETLMTGLPRALMLDIARQPWMPADPTLKPCEQDWFFGQLQVAGYNTTNLRGVLLAPEAGREAALLLADLLAKMPVSDAVLQAVSGEPGITLAQAAREHRLYAVDYAMLDGSESDPLHGQARYMAAPIALFLWNPHPPAGFPTSPEGVLQPIAIQLAQAHDPESAPVFTPGDHAGANDPLGLKWRVAKFVVNAACAMHHESIAHLGDCHLIVEPVVVAAHRQLAAQHPLLKLLLPHFRFTININDSAIHSLIVPGGVVATNVGPRIADTLRLVAQSHRAFRWENAHPDRLFQRRAVDALPRFPYRDDSRLLWAAVHRFVDAYVRRYYAVDADVAADAELQGFVAELVDPARCGFQGLPGGDQGPRTRIDCLVELVAQIIFTAGPQHAAVNYAQYPLMSYMPAVAGTIYAPMPTRSQVLNGAEDCKAWFPPLDVGLYTLSFEYLLSGVQYDRFGYYESNPRLPYFDDAAVQGLVADLQDELALAEIEIRRRNRERPLPYPFQLPSQVPNSISI